MAKKSDRGVLRELAVRELQSLLGSEPRLARAFARLARRATSPVLRKFCREGVEYTERRVERVRQALERLDAPARPRPSSAMPGLIVDALGAARSFETDREARDVAILAAIEPISHYGLATYTAVDRYLRAIHAGKARRLLVPSTKEKRDAIGEMSRMARKKLIAPIRKRGK